MLKPNRLNWIGLDRTGTIMMLIVSTTNFSNKFIGPTQRINRFLFGRCESSNVSFRHTRKKHDSQKCAELTHIFWICNQKQKICETSKQVNLRVNLPSVKINHLVYIFILSFNGKQNFFHNRILSFGCSVKTLQMFSLNFQLNHFQHHEKPNDRNK